MAKTKQAINAAALSGLDDALELEKRGQTQLMASEEFAERVAAFRSRT
jgi:enoyl-CoA hydratase